MQRRIAAFGIRSGTGHVMVLGSVTKSCARAAMSDSKSSWRCCDCCLRRGSGPAKLTACATASLLIKKSGPGLRGEGRSELLLRGDLYLQLMVSTLLCGHCGGCLSSVRPCTRSCVSDCASAVGSGSGRSCIHLSSRWSPLLTTRTVVAVSCHHSQQE